MQVTYATSPKPGKQRNEDLVGGCRNFVWLLDGASVPPDLPTCCDLDAHWYVDHLAAGMVRALLDDDERQLQDVLAAAIELVSQQHRRQCGSPNADQLGPSATVVLVRIRDDHLDYLVLGDSSLLLETGKGVVHHTDSRLAEVAPEVRKARLEHIRAGGRHDDPAFRQLSADLVAREREARNTDEGYWIASDDSMAAYHSLTGKCPIGSGLDEVQRVGLLSDGLERAVSLMGLYDSHRQLLDALISSGPAACIQKLRAAERGDPDASRNPRTKLHDDASGVVLTAH